MAGLASGCRAHLPVGGAEAGISRPMSTIAPSASTSPALRAAAARWRDGVAWWVTGARATVPPRWTAAWTGAGRPVLALVRAGTRWSCVGIGTRVPGPIDLGPEGASPASLAAWFAAEGLAREDVDLAVALSRDDLFLRPLTVPEAALPQLDAILRQDVVRRTPFAPDEIWHGGEVLTRSGALRGVNHWIVRRDILSGALDTLGVAESEVEAVALAEAGAPPRPVIRLRGGAAADGVAPGGLLRRLAAAALLVTALSVAVADAVEGARAARVADALAEARIDTEGGAAGGRDLRALLALKALPGFGAAWAELSRIVPDDTVLTELRSDDGSFAMRGASANAAALVRIVDASPLFTAAALTGGIAPNAASGRDQFGLSFDLRAKPVRKARPAAEMPR